MLTNRSDPRVVGEERLSHSYAHRDARLTGGTGVSPIGVCRKEEEEEEEVEEKDEEEEEVEEEEEEEEMEEEEEEEEEEVE